MNIAIMPSLSIARVRTGYSLRGLLRRLGQLGPRSCPQPEWSHMPDRLWRRHSAVLTYSHEADLGGR